MDKIPIYNVLSSVTPSVCYRSQLPCKGNAVNLKQFKFLFVALFDFEKPTKKGVIVMKVLFVGGDAHIGPLTSCQKGRCGHHPYMLSFIMA